MILEVNCLIAAGYRVFEIFQSPYKDNDRLMNLQESLLCSHMYVSAPDLPVSKLPGRLSGFSVTQARQVSLWIIDLNLSAF